MNLLEELLKRNQNNGSGGGGFSPFIQFLNPSPDKRPEDLLSQLGNLGSGTPQGGYVNSFGSIPNFGGFYQNPARLIRTIQKISSNQQSFGATRK